MNLSKTTAALALVTVVGVTGGCGGNSSSASAGAPSDASQSTFCSGIGGMAAGTTPKQAATKMEGVGTPSNASSSERHGFDVLVANLKKLPDNAKSTDLSAMEKSLSSTDQKDVLAFLQYFQKECANQLSSGASSPSPSN